MLTNKLASLFETFNVKSRIFLNYDALRHDFMPDELPHRDSEILHVGQVLAPALRRGKCSNLFIYGKTGTGKTAVTRWVLDKLSKRGVEIGGKVNVCYVNCRTAGTEYRVASALCSAVGVNVPFTGLATAEVLNRLKGRLDLLGGSFITALDEIDLLVRDFGDGSLYILTRVNEELKRSKLALVGISNDLYFKDMLDARVLSSLSEDELVFKPYTAEQLHDILLQRAKLAFHSGKLLESALNLCAAIAAAEHGDARRALDLLRVSGEIADRNGSLTVAEEHVREAQRKMEHDRVFEALSSLPLHSKMLLYILYFKESDSEITTGNLYESYRRLCRRLGVEALTQRRIRGLLNELIMLGVVNVRMANLGRYGRTRRFKVNVSPNMLQRIFSEDHWLSELVDPSKH